MRLLITSLIALGLIAGTVVAVMFAKGYRPNLKGSTTQVLGTGLLSASSYPEQSSVFIDDKLTTTTNDTLNLLPGTYKVRIAREGFIPWEKQLNIKKELVTSTNARLFPAAPSLSAVTFSGASLPTPSPDGQKIAYVVTTASTPEANGIWIINTASNPLGLERRPTQIADLDSSKDYTQAVLVWSYDSKQLLLAFTDNGSIVSAHLLNTDTMNRTASLTDVTVRLPFIFSGWEEELVKIQADQMKLFPKVMAELLVSSALNVYFSPDGEKVIYTAAADAKLDDHLIPEVASVNSTPQQRELKKDHIYIYDSKEDTNYEIGTAPAPSSTPTPAAKTKNPDTAPSIPVKQLLSSTDNASPTAAFNTLQQKRTPLETIQAFLAYYHPLYTNTPVWYPTSRHLITTKDSKVTILEYDNTNKSDVYSGSFDAAFALPSPNGNRLFLLANLNQGSQPLNLYTLDLK